MMAVHAAMSVIMSTAGEAVPSPDFVAGDGLAPGSHGDGAAGGDPDSSFNDVAISHFHSKWIAPDFCFMHALSGGAWALRAFQQRGRFIDQTEVDSVLHSMVTALTEAQDGEPPAPHSWADVAYQIFGPFASEPPSWIERYRCDWERLVDVALGDSVPLNATFNGDGFLDMSIESPGANGTAPTFGHGHVLPTFRRFSYQACLAGSFDPALRGPRSMDAAIQEAVGRYTATWTDDGDLSESANRVVVIDGGTGSLLSPTPAGVSLDTDTVNEDPDTATSGGNSSGRQSSSFSFSLRDTSIDGMRAAALSSAAMTDVLIRGSAAVGESTGKLSMEDIDSCLQDESGFAQTLRLAPRLSPAHELRVGDGAMCDAAGIRNALATYADNYAQLPLDEPVKLLVFEDGRGTEELASLWEEINATDGPLGSGGRTSIHQSRTVLPFAQAGSVATSADRYVGSSSLVTFRTATGRVASSVDDRLAGRPFLIGLFSIREPIGVSTQRSRPNPPQATDLAFWRRFYRDVSVDMLDVLGLQGAADQQARRRARRARRHLQPDNQTGACAAASGANSVACPPPTVPTPAPGRGPHALDEALFMPHRWWEEPRSGASTASTDFFLDAGVVIVMLLSTACGLLWSWFHLVPLQRLHVGQHHQLQPLVLCHALQPTSRTAADGWRTTSTPDQTAAGSPTPKASSPALKTSSASLTPHSPSLPREATQTIEEPIAKLEWPALDAAEAMLTEPVAPQPLDPLRQETDAPDDYTAWKAKRGSSSIGASDTTFKLICGALGIACDVQVALLVSLCLLELQWLSLSQLVLACGVAQVALGALFALGALRQRQPLAQQETPSIVDSVLLAEEEEARAALAEASAPAPSPPLLGEPQSLPRPPRAGRPSRAGPAVPPLARLPTFAMKQISKRGGQVALRGVMGADTVRRMEEEEANARLAKIRQALSAREDASRFEKAHRMAKLQSEHDEIDREQDRVLRFADYLAARSIRNALKVAKNDDERQEVREAEAAMHAEMRAAQHMEVKAAVITSVPFLRSLSRYNPLFSSMECASRLASRLWFPVSASS